MEEVEMLDNNNNIVAHVVTPSCSKEDDDILQQYRQIRNNQFYCQPITTTTTASTSNTSTMTSTMAKSYWLDKLYSGSSISQSDWNILSSKMEMNDIPFLLCDDTVVDKNENNSNVSFKCMKNNLQKKLNNCSNNNNDNNKNTSTNTPLPLVRIRGMVQDIFDPEFIEINTTTTTSNQRQYQNQQQQQQFMERIPLLITPIPSTCPWFQSMCMNSHNSNRNNDEKTDSIDTNNAKINDCSKPYNKEQVSNNNKRLKGDCDNKSSNNDTCIESSDGTMESKNTQSSTLNDTRMEEAFIDASAKCNLNANTYNNNNFGTDRINSNCTDHIDNNNNRWWNSKIMNSDQRQIPVVGKLYYDQYPNVGIEQIRLNNVIDCIGILEWESNDDDDANNDDNNGEDNDDDDDTNNHATNDHNRKQQQQGIDNKKEYMEEKDNLESLFDDDQYATSNNDFDLDNNHTDEIIVPPNSIPRLHIVWFEQISLEDCYVTNIGNNTTGSTCTTTAELEQPNSGTIVHTSNNIKTPPPQRLLQQLIGTSNSYVVATSIWMTLLSMAERGNNSNNTNRNNNDDDSNALSALSLPTITPHGTTLGCASLNIIVSSIASAKQIQYKLYSVLSDIVPVLYNFEITNTTITSCTCTDNTIPENELLPSSVLSVPHKLNGRTIPSIWQFPKGSTIILNISSLNSNNFVSNDIKNILQLLQMITYKHSIQYTFDGNIQIPFEADIRIIVLSTVTNKDELICMLNVVQYDTNYRNYNNCNKNNITIDNDEKKLNQENDIVESDDDDSDADELDIEYDTSRTVEVDKNNDIKMNLRQLLANCRRSKSVDKNINNTQHNNNNISLSKPLLQRAKDDFIGRRQKWQQQRQQKDQPTKNQLPQGQQQIHHHQPGEDDFHRWLTLCRLVARNRQSTIADICDWDIALQIDDDMQQTLLLLKYID